MSVGQGSSLGSGLALEELQLCWTCLQKKHWKMQAKAVVVVERVCGTLHTDTTGENQTCRERDGADSVRETFINFFYSTGDLDLISMINTAHLLGQSFNYNQLYNTITITCCLPTCLYGGDATEYYDYSNPQLSEAIQLICQYICLVSLDQTMQDQTVL